MEIYLTRHGQSIWQIERDENFDTRLTSLGEEQAARLAAWLVACPDGPPINRIRCSPLERAVQTARPISESLGVPVERDADLTEADFWIAPTLPAVDHPLQAATGWLPALQYAAFKEQARRALDRLVAEAETSGQPVLAVAHGGLIATILRLMVGSDHIAFWSHNTGLHKIEWSRGRWQITYLNRLEHLPDAMRTF